MGVSNLVLVAAAALGLALPAAEAQNDDELAVGSAQARGVLKPWRNGRSFGRVLDLSKFPVVIDEPGLYAIDRNWQIPREVTAANPELIRITADDVTLDLHGFSISADSNAPPVTTLIAITGAEVEIRNGALSACCQGAVTVRSTGAHTRLHHLSIFSHETMAFEGDSASFTDSDIAPRVEMQFAGHSNLERNTISCNRGRRCIRLLGDQNRITDNRMSLSQGGGIAILGDRSIVANNIVDVTDAVDAFEAFEVAGDNNVVRGNTVLLGGITGNAIAIYLISGTANTLDGNIAAPSSTTSQQPRAGMAFTADGNYYGDNRMAAQVPFALGGTVQTDWGDNVPY
jgi:hypothetical protein